MHVGRASSSSIPKRAARISRTRCKSRKKNSIDSEAAVLTRIYEPIRKWGWSRSDRSRSRISIACLSAPDQKREKRGGGGGEENEKLKKMKRKKKEGGSRRRRRERGRWKVKPGFLEGNAPVNPAHKSSTINRVTGWAVNRKHVLRQSPTQRPSTSLFHANARHWRIFSFDCAPVLRFYNTPFVFNALRTLPRSAIECPFQSNFSRIRVSWQCFIFFFLFFFFFFPSLPLAEERWWCIFEWRNVWYNEVFWSCWILTSLFSIIGQNLLESSLT